MADETIGEAAEKVAAQGGEVDLRPSAEAEAAERGEVAPVSAGGDSTTQALIDHLTRRVDQLESDLALALEKSSRYATTDHSHPNSSNVQTIIDALDEIDREEQAPNRQRFWQRKVFGGR